MTTNQLYSIHYEFIVINCPFGCNLRPILKDIHEKTAQSKLKTDFTFNHLCMNLFQTKNTDIVEDCLNCFGAVFLKKAG